MRPVAPACLALACLAAFASPPTVAATLCPTGEIVLFQCSLRGGKQVSVCASHDATPQTGRLQYRFGRPGRAPELILPSVALPPARSASADTLMFSGGGGAWLRFRSGAHSYTVFTAIGRWGRDGDPAEKEGVVVERAGRRLASLPCLDSAESELGPELYRRLGLGPGSPDESFDLPP